MSLSQESMLSRNRSSVLPLLLLKLLLCMSCLRTGGGGGGHVWLQTRATGWGSARDPREGALTQSGEQSGLTSELKRSFCSEDGRRGS